MKTTHTPGDWRVSKSGTCVDRNDGSQVRIVRATSGPALLADAQLIAASPDLLEAADDALDYLGGLSALTELNGYGQKVAQKLAAALRKARARDGVDAITPEVPHG